METNQVFEKPLVTKIERAEIAKRAILFGDKVKVKIPNFDVEIQRLIKERQEAGQSLRIIIRPYKQKSHVDSNLNFSFVKDSEYDILYAIPAGVHADGNIIYQKIHIGGQYDFNLQNADDAKKFILCRMHPEVRNSFAQVTDPRYEFYDPETEAKEELVSAEAAEIAMDRSKLLSGYDMVSFARFIGIQVDNGMSANMLKSKIRSEAWKRPLEFNAAWDHNDRVSLEIINSGIKVGLIKESPDKGYTYQGTPLGTHQQAVVNYFRQNPDIRMAIAGAIRDNDDIAARILAEEEKNIKAKPKDTTKDKKEKGKEKDPPPPPPANDPPVDDKF